MSRPSPQPPTINSTEATGQPAASLKMLARAFASAASPTVTATTTMRQPTT